MEEGAGHHTSSPPFPLPPPPPHTGPYYPIPLVGPILIGTLSGCMGAFMPPDRGISFIQAGVPLNIQVRGCDSV